MVFFCLIIFITSNVTEYNVHYYYRKKVFLLRIFFCSMMVVLFYSNASDIFRFIL